MYKRMIGTCFVVIMLLLVSCTSDNNKSEESGENVTQVEVEVVETSASVEEVESIEKEVIEEYIEPDDSDNPKLPAIMTYIGRATMKIEFADETVVYIDPFAGEDSAYDTEADLVLVTHQHGDHNRTSRVTL